MGVDPAAARSATGSSPLTGVSAARRAVVTIASEHGAGGDLLAPRVAEVLGVPFLDRAVPRSLVEAAERAERENPLLSRLARASTMLAGAPLEHIEADEGRVRAELGEFLVGASKEGGVVLGRGAAVVLRDTPGALHVLLTGDHDARVARVAEREGIGLAEADERVRAHDRARREYTRRGYGVDSDDRTLYHLIVDTLALGVEASVELVLCASHARTRQPEKES
jgi:cytidylate kinase